MILNQDLKEKVYNLNLLKALEERIDQLKNEKIYQQQTENVIKLIDELPTLDEVTLDDERKINGARTAYNLLVESFKNRVENIGKLIDLERQIQYLKHEEAIQSFANEGIYLIDLLSLISELIIEDGELIINARKGYNALTEQSKDRVTNYQKLVESEKKINEIRSYNVVYYNIEEDELDNVSEVIIPKNILKTKVNYYTTGFWSKYSSEMFIFKTSLFSSSNRYQYALKIGFNYDSMTNDYKVIQIIESSIRLTEDIRESEYYLLIHNNYTDLYDVAQKIELGDIISIDKVLPDASTETLDANIEIISSKTLGFEKCFIATYQGETTLPIPKREGYIFLGWYDNRECIGNQITTIYEANELFASWIQDVNFIEPRDMLSCMRDMTTSTIRDTLVNEVDNTIDEWSASVLDLHAMQNRLGILSKRCQIRNKKTIEFSKIKEGSRKKKAKEIVVNSSLYAYFSFPLIITEFYSKEMSYFQEYNNGQLIDNGEDQYLVTYDSIEVVKAKNEYVFTVYEMGLMRWCYPFDINESFPKTLYEKIYG